MIKPLAYMFVGGAISFMLIDQKSNKKMKKMVNSLMTKIK